MNFSVNNNQYKHLSKDSIENIINNYNDEQSKEFIVGIRNNSNRSKVGDMYASRYAQKVTTTMLNCKTINQ